MSLKLESPKTLEAPYFTSTTKLVPEELANASKALEQEYFMMTMLDNNKAIRELTLSIQALKIILQVLVNQNNQTPIPFNF
ncbi:13776_t:CDS:2 [Funneliformis mosseae]|uniref:13776_t:CDS:1 n=1 Tax=Funneliformis mosseae TaxID=27381 RepID=A0A9N8V1D3_FUNMO|nr:13776_t:CDS:2 [Funneliformis mosseae]